MAVRTIPPPPPEFAEQFALGGWERVERIYGARSDLVRKWIALTGAQCRRAMKGAVAQPQGSKADGMRGWGP